MSRGSLNLVSVWPAVLSLYLSLSLARACEARAFSRPCFFFLVSPPPFFFFTDFSCVCLFARLSCLFACLPACLSVCLSVHVSVFQGFIPKEIGGLSRLRCLRLDHNQLMGEWVQDRKRESLVIRENHKERDGASGHLGTTCDINSSCVVISIYVNIINSLGLVLSFRSCHRIDGGAGSFLGCTRLAVAYSIYFTDSARAFVQ